MKRKDLAVIAMVAIVAAIFSFVVSGAIFGNSKNNNIKVPVVDRISSTFPSPQNDDSYKKFFNSNALNPTQLIQIGGSSNTAPFQSGTQ